MPTPDKLYKYREFGNATLRMFSEATVYYADPRTFNDPLDCDPTLKKGVTLEELEGLCRAMLEAEQERNYPAAAATRQAKADERISYLRYMATEVGDYRTDVKASRYYTLQLGSEVKRLLAAEMAPRGVLSLSAKWDSSLMWSHYASGHNGICLEFDMQGHQCQNLRKVRYSPHAIVEAGDLIQWKLHESHTAAQRVFDTYFLTKASAWKYEQEWRDVSQTTGIQPMPFRLSGIHFGLKCEHWIRASIVKLLANSPGEPDAYFEMTRIPGRSDLGRRQLDDDDIEEMKATAIRSSPLLDFHPIPGE
ncbi:MAG: hypothetical protein DCC67_13120 [Planctomycetota bacterium]|nr:MAG: hypothetical protein DCC67_13120 [Planctomycetota bacterium]